MSDVVPNGDSSSSSGQLTDLKSWNWQEFQLFYHAITGRKEALRRHFAEPYQLTFQDIEDLHRKICQAVQPYPRCAENESVTVTYVDGSSVEHSSFARFKVQANIGNTAVKSVSLRYNLAIRGSEVDVFGQYKVDVRLHSGVAVFKDIQNEVPKMFWHTLGYRTGFVKVEYADFSVAQNIFNVICQWFQGRNVAPRHKALDWIQKRTEHLPRLAEWLVLVVCVASFVLTLSNKALDLANGTAVARYLLVSLGIIWLLTSVAYSIGEWLEGSIDRIWKLAFIKLNDGDARLVTETESHNRASVIATLQRIGGYLGLVVFSNLIGFFVREALK